VSNTQWTEEQIAEALRPAVARIFNNLDELSPEQALQILVDALRNLDAPQPIQAKSEDPHANDCRRCGWTPQAGQKCPMLLKSAECRYGT